MNDSGTSRPVGLRYLAWPEVIEISGMSKSTLKRAIRSGEFPSPRRLTPGRVGFRSDEVDHWLNTRPSVISSARP